MTMRNGRKLLITAVLIGALLGGCQEAVDRPKPEPPDLPAHVRSEDDPEDLLPLGSGTLNWSSDVPVEEWEGVTVDDNGSVTAVELTDRQLTGPIPATTR